MSDQLLLWNKEAALNRMMGKPALLEKVTGLFLAQFPEVWASAKSNIAQRNWAQVKAQAHTLKGSAAELGLEALADVLFSLERAASSQDLDQATEAQSRIEFISKETLTLLNN